MAASTAIHSDLRSAMSGGRRSDMRPSPHRAFRWWARVRPRLALAVVLSGVVGGGLIGCGSDSSGVAGPRQLYWALHFNWPAVNLALSDPRFDTAQLVATPVTPTGVPIVGAGPVQYRAVDSNVTVSPTGLVTAHYPVSQTYVVASLTVNGATHTDTAWIQVTQDPVLVSPLATLSIQPHPGDLDSTRVALGYQRKLNRLRGKIPVYATDSLGNDLCDPRAGCPFLVAFGSSDPLVATLDPTGRLSTVDVGHVTFTVSALVYGVGKRDTLPFTVGYPLSGGSVLVYPNGTTPPISPLLPLSTTTIGVGGFVGIADNRTNEAMEVSLPYATPVVHRIFSSKTQLTDTVAAGGGGNDDIVVQFDSAGTYTFHLKLLESGTTATGTVVVSSGP